MTLRDDSGRVSGIEEVRKRGHAEPNKEECPEIKGWPGVLGLPEVTNTNEETGYDGLLLLASKADCEGSFKSPEEKGVGSFPEVQSFGVHLHSQRWRWRLGKR